jgi:hypothetical protein
MRLEPSPHVKRMKSQRSAESRGFPQGILRFSPTGKVDRVG